MSFEFFELFLVDHLNVLFARVRLPTPGDDLRVLLGPMGAEAQGRPIVVRVGGPLINQFDLRMPGKKGVICRPQTKRSKG